MVMCIVRIGRERNDIAQQGHGTRIILGTRAAQGWGARALDSQPFRLKEVVACTFDHCDARDNHLVSPACQLRP